MFTITHSEETRQLQRLVRTLEGSSAGPYRSLGETAADRRCAPQSPDPGHALERALVRSRHPDTLDPRVVPSELQVPDVWLRPQYACMWPSTNHRFILL